MTLIEAGRILVAVALAATLAACGETRGAEKLASGARITLADAIGRAVAQVPGGRAVKAELKQQDGRLLYAVDVARANRTIGLQVDATDGHIARREEDNADRSREAAAPVPLAKAVETASSAGQPVAAEIEQAPGDVLRIEVDVVTDGRTREVEVNAATGVLTELKR
jgi:uncharacterized membrane protein YkoI